MEEEGIPLSRWVDGVLEAKDNIEQSDTLKAMIYWGHAPNSQTRGPDLKKAFEKLDLLVVIDPHPTVSAVMHDRTDGVYLLPAATQYETAGSVTASNRSLQWREKVFAPLFEAKRDHEIIYLLAKKLGFEKEMFKNIKVENNEPVVEDITREFNGGSWTIGYTGQSPERLKLHMANQDTFDRTTLQGQGRPVRRRLLRTAVAVLGHRRDQASRHAATSTTPPSPSPRAASTSAPSGGSVKRQANDSGRRTIPSRTACWPSTAIRRVPRSRTATRP